MHDKIDEILRRSPIFRRLSLDDRQRLAAVAHTHDFEKGAPLFGEGDPSDALYTVVSGRVKVFKTTARGTDVILEIFGPGEAVGAVAVYESRAYPASAVAIEPTTCLLIPRQAFFSLLETHPTEQVVRDGAAAGIHHLWLQQGAESARVIDACADAGIEPVSGGCILMFARPTGFHKAHRWLWKLTGKLPT